MIAFILAHQTALLLLTNALAVLAICHVVIHDDAPRQPRRRSP